MECSRKRRLVQELNDFFLCKLCHGYLVDATTLVDCLHTFCRGCILRHFDNSKTHTQCPVCPVLYKKKAQCFRSDTQLQSLVYKSVPSLYFREMQQREDFYRSTGVRAGSSCSDDSVIDRERDTMMHETEELISQCVGDKTQYFNQDDLISLSLEYYQAHLDTTEVTSAKHTKNGLNDRTVDNMHSEKSKNNGQICNDSDASKVPGQCDKRYLQCPAGVNMKHLQKFVRMKYGLTGDHRVDIIYKGEVLPNNFSLMDVAYSFQWEKVKPMRFFYRIFTPLKIRPIKIVTTPTATGGKQLQIVPITSNNHAISPSANSTTNIKSPKIADQTVDVKPSIFNYEETERQQKDKERLLANLELQIKAKVYTPDPKKVQVPEKLVKECVFEYEEPDQEEIKRFAEKRDREWAMQKKLEEETKADHEDFFNYPSKKRKKSKHSKNESNGHKEKKRKLHAEITNNDKSDLKLKVKITTNGHKHKHHKIDTSEISNKEKLLQMRQVRHKHLSGSSGDEPNPPTIPTIKVPKVFVNDVDEPEVKKKKENPKVNFAPTVNHIGENNNKPLKDVKVKINPLVMKSALSTKPKVIKKDFNVSVAVDKVMPKPFFNKTIKDPKVKIEPGGTVQSKVLPIGSITTNSKSLDRKIASLQQRCTIEPKIPQKTNDKLLPAQYPPGFTVSKIETGNKKKLEGKDVEKKPSLEITLIPNNNGSVKPGDKPTAKRPPPGTIPLERIKNAISLKSGISIIPKVPDSNAGALDLSKTNKLPVNSPKADSSTNGINSMVNRPLMAPKPMTSPDGKNMQLSNLQMLSKVALEHPTLNKLTNPTKVRPQIPNLQSINNKSIAVRAPVGVQRLPPKLNDIQKFRPSGGAPQIRSIRPNPNQNIRNIPNPSLILNRNMTQNRVVSSTNNTVQITPSQTITEKKVVSPKPSPVPTTNPPLVATKDVPPLKTILEQKVVESKEISVN